LVGRVKSAGLPVRVTDHGYCKSMYCTSPDGLIMEFTVDPPNAAQIDAIRRSDAHSELARWMAGDHRVNNDLRLPAAG
jgi:catechol-2,3-dioxygenase